MEAQVENGLKLTGHIQVFVERAKRPGIQELLVDQENTINNEFKTVVRNTMNSNVDFALDNLQATSIANASLGAGANGKDGVIIGNGDPATESYLPADPTAPNFMASVVHPTDESGNYYRQWQGTFQNLLAGAVSINGAILGLNYLNTDQEAFVTRYAIGTFSNVSLAQNDIITINWKITVG